MKARIPGGQGGGQMAMMKRIQEMQAQMEAKQQEIEQSEFSASAGGGAVEVTVTGAHDLLIAATNEAMRKADDAMEQAMGAFKSGLNLPF